MDRTFFEELESIDSRSGAFEFFADHHRNLGFGMVTYFVPEGTFDEACYFHAGVTPEWLDRVRRHAIGQTFSIPRTVISNGRLMLLSDVVASFRNLGREEAEFVSWAQSSGFLDGIGVPAFGPRDRAGFVGLTRLNSPELLQSVDLLKTNAAVQAFHNRMELLLPPLEAPHLSPREREVLRWIAKGKSTDEIAIILGSKATTVSTHVKRVFHKLKTHDRVTCVTKAMALHLL